MNADPTAQELQEQAARDYAAHQQALADGDGTNLLAEAQMHGHESATSWHGGK